MLDSAWKFGAVLIAGEVMALLLYRLVINRPYQIPMSKEGVVGGMVERFFLFLAFVNGLPWALIFFGALKIATHISPGGSGDEDAGGDGESDGKPKQLPKTYYLIGNLASASLAIAYLMVWRLWVTSTPL